MRPQNATSCIANRQSFLALLTLLLLYLPSSPISAQIPAPPHLTTWAEVDDTISGAYASLTNDAMIYPPGPWHFRVGEGRFTFAPDGEVAALTNLAPCSTQFNVPVWLVSVVETQTVPRAWLYAGTDGLAFRTNELPTSYDPQQWVRDAYRFDPPGYLTGSNLDLWYAARDRSRFQLELTLVNSNDWPTLQAAEEVAATNNAPPPETPPPVLPADTNRLAFAGILAGQTTLDMWIYSPSNRAVDVLTRAALTSVTNGWNLHGSFQATSAFKLWHANAAAETGFFLAGWGDVDTDGDAIPDLLEVYTFGTNPDSTDSDGDSLSDWAEIYIYESDPNNADTSGDGLGDGWKVANGLNPTTTDTDGDGLTDVAEMNGWTVPLGWGQNQVGEAATAVALTNAVAVSAGGFHSLALLADGHVVAWGNNSEGQCDVPADVTNAIAVAAGGGHNMDVLRGTKDGGHSMALLADGLVRCWGWSGEGETNVPPDVSSSVVTAIAAGGFHSVALRSDGTVRVWGDTSCGQTNVPPGLSNVVAVAAGDSFTIALKSDGRVVAWGYSQDYGQTNVPPELGTNAAAIAAGARHAVVLKKDGAILCWGRNDSGQCNVPAYLATSHVVAVAAGDRHTVALLSNNTVVCWGTNDWGQCSVPACATNVQAIAACGTHNVSLAHIRTDPRNPDTDGDGVADGAEMLVWFTNPADPDSDHDGMPDGWEVTAWLDATNGVHYLNPNRDDSQEDPDDDTLTNQQEYQNGTNPFNADTDGDGVADGVEIAMGTGPANAGSVPTAAQMAQTVIVEVFVADDSGELATSYDDDEWALKFTGMMYCNGQLVAFTNQVVAWNYMNVYDPGTAVLVLPLGQTVSFGLERMGGEPPMDEYGVGFTPVGGRTDCWLARAGNSDMQGIIDWTLDDTLPPDPSGLQWVFDVPKVELKSVGFTSDHKLLMKNPVSGSVWGDSGVLYETPEWVAGTRNNPVSHTMNTNVSLLTTFCIKPAGLSFAVTGNGGVGYMSFSTTGQTSTGSDQDILLTSDAKLPNSVCTLGHTIDWKVSFGQVDCTAGTSGSHKMYVTYGTPSGSDPTEQRMSWSCQRASGTSSIDDIALAAHAFINTNTPPNFDIGTTAWPTGTPPIWMMLDPNHSGGACLAYANLLKHIVNVLGVPGGSLVPVYSSSDTNYTAQETLTIAGRTCTVVVAISVGNNLWDMNFLEGTLELNSRYYPGAMGTLSYATKQTVHAAFAAWPRRLIYMTVDGGPTVLFDKDFVQYTDPNDITQAACIPIP